MIALSDFLNDLNYLSGLRLWQQSALNLQNYTPGNPAAVLYIKNLAKDVVPDDFYFIFGKYSYIFEASSVEWNTI